MSFSRTEDPTKDGIDDLAATITCLRLEARRGAADEDLCDALDCLSTTPGKSSSQAPTDMVTMWVHLDQNEGSEHCAAT